MKPTPSADVIAPIIHPNGDRASTLIEGLEEQYDALSVALDIMCKCRPHGRNYYPVPGLYEKADDQQSQRIAQVKAVQDTLLAELYAIQAQIK